MVKITKELLQEGLSRNGAYNGAQMEVLEIEPAWNKGWKRRLLGKLITEQQKETFLALKDSHLVKKIHHPEQKMLWQNGTHVRTIAAITPPGTA